MPNYDNICFTCGSVNLAYGEPVYTPDGGEAEVWCRDCGEEWVELLD